MHLRDLSWKGKPETAPRGSSLGNPDCFVRADGESNLDGFYLAANTRWYTGELRLELLSPGDTVLKEVTFAPALQAATYANDSEETWVKRIYVPANGAKAYLEIHGKGFAGRKAVTVRCDWRIGAARSEMHRAQPLADTERQWKLDTTWQSIPRFIPTDGEPDSQALWASHAASESVWSEPARMRYTHEIPVGTAGTFHFWVCLTVQGEGPQGDATRPNRVPSPHDVEQTLADLTADEDTLPDVTEGVRKAVAWGKIGTFRVWHRYATGDEGFTNDPPGHTIVTRDAAWLLFGTDWFAPRWSRALLETLRNHALYPSGKIAEYVRISPHNIDRNDYNLNLNDATPLYVCAVAHHWHTTKDAGVLTQFYPSVRDAALYIVAQKRDDGLVWCDGQGTNVFGIGGWRNIIPAYRLAGTLTELNAECVAALRAARDMAQAIGDAANAALFAREADQLNTAMSQLVDPNTGFFLLTRDENGPNPQLALELAFPALFGAGPEEARVRTALRLLEPDFESPAGLRAVSRNDPAYHPTFGWGLLGGSWPNATAWVAAACAAYEPERAWQLTETIARLLYPDGWQGGAGVSVPGQFAEWHHGDTGASMGMSLSPWMPATFVWLVKEGLRAPAGTQTCGTMAGNTGNEHGV